MRFGRIVATAAALAAALAARRAEATPTSKLTYVRGGGAESCPDETFLRKAVARRVGYDPFFPWAERTVVALIDRTSKGAFSGQMRIIDGRGTLLGERTIETVTECGELVENVALAISVAIDDLDAALPPPTETAAAEPPRPPERKESEPPPTVAASADSPAIASPRTRESRRFHARVSSGAVLSLGSAPSAAIGGVAGIAGRFSWLSLGLEGRLDAPATAVVTPGGKVETSLIAASLMPCAVIPISPSPYLCAVASLGTVHATASDITGPRETSGRYAALGGRAGVDISLYEWLSAYVQVDVGGTMTRHRLELNGADVYRLPAASVSAGAGLAATFF